MVELKGKGDKPIELKDILYIYRDPWVRWSKEEQSEKRRVHYYYNTKKEGETASYALGTTEILGSEYCDILESMSKITKLERVKQPTKVICVKYKNQSKPFYYIKRSDFISLNEKVNGGDPNISELEIVIPGATPVNPNEVIKLNLRETIPEEAVKEFFENQIKDYGDLEKHEEKDAYAELPQLILEFSDGRGFKFSSKREIYDGISAMKKDQEFMKTPEYARIRGRRSVPVVNPRVNTVPMTPEEEVAKNAKNRKKGITLAVIFGTLLLAGEVILISHLIEKYMINKNYGQDLSPTFTPTIEAKYTPEPSATATSHPTPLATATPSPTPKKVYKTGEDFINELREKNYKYLINGDEVEFTAEKAENLFKLLEGKHDEVFAGLSDYDKRIAIDEYKKIIMIYCYEAFDISTKGPVDLKDYCNMDVTLYEKMSKEGRILTDLSVDQPLNGAELNSKDLIEKFSDKYIQEMGSFVKIQMSFVRESPEYKELNNWYSFFLGTVLENVNNGYVPEYCYVIDEGIKIFNISFEYKDENGNTIEYQPIMTNEGVRFENRNTGKYATLEQMEDCMNPQSKDYDPSLKTTGIAAKTMRDREEANKAIFEDEGLTYRENPVYNS